MGGEFTAPVKGSGEVPSEVVEELTGGKDDEEEEKDDEEKEKVDPVMEEEEEKNGAEGDGNEVGEEKGWTREGKGGKPREEVEEEPLVGRRCAPRPLVRTGQSTSFRSTHKLG